MTRRRWSIAASVTVAVVIVLFVVGTFTQQPRALFGDGGLFRPDGSSTSSPGAEPTPEPTPEPWTELNLPGYDADPGPLTLTPVAEASGEPITASFALEPGASPIGGTVGLSFDAVELASELWDSPQSNLTLMLSELDRPALRFGGNGMDRRAMWWTSTDEPAPSWADVDGHPGRSGAGRRHRRGRGLPGDDRSRPGARRSRSRRRHRPPTPGRSSATGCSPSRSATNPTASSTN